MNNSYKNFGIALLSVFSAAFITLIVPALSDGGMYFLFLTAIIFSTLRGDASSGAFAAALSILLNFLLLHYLGKPPKAFGEWLVLFAFGLAAGFTVFICREQMKAEIARRLAESRYRMIFEDAITGIYETTIDGRYAAANPKLAETFGYSSSGEMIREAENLNRRFYTEPERREEFKRLVEENESVAGFESEIYRRDGAKIWILENALAVRDEKGKLIGFQGTTIEITDRKKAEAALVEAHEELEGKVAERTAELEKINAVLRTEINERQRVETALRESEEKFRTLVETSSDFIWEIDENAFYTYASPKIKDIIGCEPEEILGKRPYDLMPPEEAERVKQVVRQLSVIKKGYTLFEAVVVHKNGSFIITETSSVPIFDEAGNVRGSRGIARDITRRKRIETELLASQKQLRDLSGHLESVREEERKYIARELHDELGQTLTALKIDLTKLSERMSNLQNETVRMQIIERIPAMIKIADTAMETTRKIVAALRPGVLDELGLDAAAEWQVREFQKLTGIKCDFQTNLAEKELSPNLVTAMFRILQECLTNIARHAAATNVKIELTDEVDFLSLLVEDDGRGIGKRKHGNTKSFGISGMRERALLLGGTFEISRPEKGTSVKVRIPC